MPIFDFCVRKDNEEPPVKQAFVLFNGYLSSSCVLNVSLILYFHLYAYHRWGLTVLAVYLILVITTTLLGDTLVSNHFGKNIQNLRNQGYSDAVVASIMMFNMIGSQILGYVIVTHFAATENDSQHSGGDDDAMYYTIHQTLEMTTYQWLTLFCRIGCNLLVSEVAFWAGHSIMHTNKSLMHYHVLHHCATFNSWNSNILFHPVDLAIEFAGPALFGLLGMHFLCWKEDKLTLLLTYTIFQIWYALEHDECMQFQHTKHHEYCNSNYAIYSDISLFHGGIGDNKLRYLMMDLSNSKSATDKGKQIAWPKGEAFKSQ